MTDNLELNQEKETMKSYTVVATIKQNGGEEVTLVMNPNKDVMEMLVTLKEYLDVNSSVGFVICNSKSH